MLNLLMILAAKYLYLVIILFAIYYFIFTEKIRKKILIALIFILPTAFIFSRILNGIYYNPRPFVIGHFVPLITHAADNGFPSDHSLISFAIASVVFLFHKKWGLILVVLGFIVGFSRVYAGIHHPIDIFGSFMISIVTVFIFNKFIKPRLKSVLQ